MRSTVVLALAALLASGVPAQAALRPDAGPRLTVGRPPAPVVVPLRVQGNRLVDGRGRTLILRGIHRDGLENSSSVSITADEVAHLHDWRANVVRIPLALDRWLGTAGCPPPQRYRAAVDRVVQLVTGASMVALLDLHTVAGAGCTQLERAPLPPVRAVAFWHDLATRYRSNARVIFDLYNEPYGVDGQTWLSGGSVTWRGIRYTAAGMQQLYDAVRSAGSQAVVLVSGLGWASSWPQSAADLRGYGIVWGLHAYTCPTLPPSQGGQCRPGPAGDYDPSAIMSRFVLAGLSRPVVVSEFGWPDRNDGTYLRNVISFAEANGWGWVAFAWDGTTSGRFDLLDDLREYRPSAAGAPVLLGLQRN